MKRILFVGLILFVSTFAMAKPRYIEVSEMLNISEIEFSSLEDFEPFADGDVFYCPKTLKVYVLKDDTYYSYNLNGYKTIADLHSGKDYMESKDYYEAVRLNIPDAEKYYERMAFFKKNSDFESFDDAIDAYDKGFWKIENNPEFEGERVSLGTIYYKSEYRGIDLYIGYPISRAYYDAKNSGINDFDKYVEHIFLKKHGFDSIDTYKVAKSKGFSYYSEYEKGFSTKIEYDDAKKYGLLTAEEYKSYNKITAEIDKLVTSKKFSKYEAVVYHYIASFEKGDVAFVKLMEGTKLQMSAENKNVKSAIERYVDGRSLDSNSYHRSYGNIMENYVTEETVRKVIDNSKELGKYNEKKGIFTKK